MATAKPAAQAKPAAAILSPQKPVETAAAPQVQATPAAVAVAGSGGAVVSASFMAELASHAKDAAAKERPSVGRISLKSGVMSYEGNPVAGNKMEVVIVGGAYRNVFYAGRYDPNNIVNPNCFALGEEQDEMEAHENVDDEFVPKDDPEKPRDEMRPRACNGCSMNAWGSSLTGGRGKACKETRRLMLLPATDLEDVEGVMKSEMAILDVPVTSVRNYANLVNSAATMGFPTWAVVTMIEVVPDAKTQFQVKFTPLRPAGGEETIRSLMKRRDEAMRLALVPYDGSGGEADPDAGAPAPKATPAKRKF